MSESKTEVFAVGLSLENSSSAVALLERLRPLIEVDPKAKGRIIAFPELLSLVFLKEQALPVPKSEIVKAQKEAEHFLSLVAEEFGAWVAGAYPRFHGDLLRESADIVAPHGECQYRVSKVNLIAEELALGFSPAPYAPIPPLHTSIGRIGQAICFDAFSTKYLEDMGPLDFLCVPSANPQIWRAKARNSSAWQPDEWADALERAALTTGAVVINPMLHGTWGDTIFDGQTSVTKYSSYRAAGEFPRLSRAYNLSWLGTSEVGARGDQVVKVVL